MVMGSLWESCSYYWPMDSLDGHHVGEEFPWADKEFNHVLPKFHGDLGLLDPSLYPADSGLVRSLPIPRIATHEGTFPIVGQGPRPGVSALIRPVDKGFP